MVRRVLAAVAFTALAGVLGGCVSGVLAGPATGCPGGMLAVAEPAGAACLEQLQTSQRVARWMAENGAPDYIETESSRNVRFFYVERDAVVNFGGGFFSSFEPKVAGRIRSLDHSRFSDADRARLGSKRMDAAAKPIPAEPPPGGGVLRRRVGEDR